MKNKDSLHGPTQVASQIELGNSKREQLLENMKSNVNTLYILINSILAFSKEIKCEWQNTKNKFKIKKQEA